MRVCAIVKYPPIQGGVSAQSYWLCRALAEAGHEVHVVTNADEVEDDYRLVLNADDEAWLEPTFEHGRVRVHRTERLTAKLMHVPQSNPFVDKLAGMATDVVRRYGCEVIYSYYLEPYGVAAHLCSHWTGVPYVVRNAGSDVGRLMNRPGLGTTYREVFRHAHGVCAGSPYPYIGMGVRPECIYPGPRPETNARHFNPAVEPLDLNAHLAEVVQEHPGLVSNRRPLDPTLPVVGIYGKMGVTKGSYDLLSALGLLRKQGLRFNFVALTRGRGMASYLEAIEAEGLSEVTWVLPFVAHWKVARFIRACRAVCFLERDFPIVFHTPTVPREVLSCGTCLILSGEIAAKQPLAEALISGDNLLIVPDPKVHTVLAEALRRAIEDPAAAEQIGRRGAALVSEGRDAREKRDVGREYERILADVVARHRGAPSAIPLEERGLPSTRGAALRALAPLLLDAFGPGADAALAAFVEAHPAAPSGPFEDAAALCAWAASADPAPGGSPDMLEIARYCGLLVWLGRMDLEEAAEPPFDREDLWEPRRPGREPEALGGFVPLRSRWVRIERFRALPPGLPAPGGAGAGGAIFVFHKQPNANGHHFRINPWTADLLGQCDGTRTVDEIIERTLSRTDRPAAEVARAMRETLQRLHREGIVIFTDRAGRRRRARAAEQP